MVGEDRKAGQSDHRDPAGQAVEAVEKVDGVDHPDHGENREGDGDPDRQNDWPDSEEVAESMDVKVTDEDGHQAGDDLAKKLALGGKAGDIVDQPGAKNHQPSGENSPHRCDQVDKDQTGKEEGDKNGDAANARDRRRMHLAGIGLVNVAAFQRPTAQRRHHDQRCKQRRHENVTVLYRIQDIPLPYLNINKLIVGDILWCISK